MDLQTFQRLLYESESESLDFKERQYPFVRATDDEKSELLKDILGFVNAWRRTEAFILIGVREHRGGEAEVVGIGESEHLGDHSLQQFVNSLVTRPVRFCYETLSVDGKHVGVIRIEQQPRPVCLKRDYGKLRQQTVYVRRGSSTDPTRPASPDEIAWMGSAPIAAEAELEVQFARKDSDAGIGAEISCDAERCRMPDDSEIPDMRPPGLRLPGGWVDLPEGLGDRTCKSYFRDLALFEFVRRLYRPVRLLIQNTGRCAARGVRIELRLASAGSYALSERDLPRVPRRRESFYCFDALRGVRPASSREPGQLTIERSRSATRIEVECGDLQPGRRVWSEPFLVGRGESGELVLEGHVLADNLSSPVPLRLTVAITVAQTTLTVEELCALPEPDEE